MICPMDLNPAELELVNDALDELLNGPEAIPDGSFVRNG